MSKETETEETAIEPQVDSITLREVCDMAPVYSHALEKEVYVPITPEGRRQYSMFMTYMHMLTVQDLIMSIKTADAHYTKSHEILDLTKAWKILNELMFSAEHSEKYPVPPATSKEASMAKRFLKGIVDAAKDIEKDVDEEEFMKKVKEVQVVTDDMVENMCVRDGVDPGDPYDNKHPDTHSPYMRNKNKEEDAENTEDGE